MSNAEHGVSWLAVDSNYFTNLTVTDFRCLEKTKAKPANKSYNTKAAIEFSIKQKVRELRSSTAGLK